MQNPFFAEFSHAKLFMKDVTNSLLRNANFFCQVLCGYMAVFIDKLLNHCNNCWGNSFARLSRVCFIFNALLSMLKCDELCSGVVPCLLPQPLIFGGCQQQRFHWGVGQNNIYYQPKF